VLTHDNVLTLVPEDGSSIGFDALRAALSEQLRGDIAEDDLGRLIFAMGSLQPNSRAIEWLPDERRLRRRSDDGVPNLPHSIEREKDLEPWFERYLWLNARSFYDPAPRNFSIVVENTARTVGAGRRWSRPDLCLACVSRYLYRPVPMLDLHSFELKMPDGCNMLAVHEALSHTAAAHYAHLGIYLPDGPDSKKAEAHLPDMLMQARRHGVGVIIIHDPKDMFRYQRVLEAQRHEPAPSHIDSFIDERFSSSNMLALKRWVRP
jgi:hypothetical protein